MVVYVGTDEPPPEHKWLNKPMSLHELIAEILATALEDITIALDEITAVTIESYHNHDFKPYGGAWLVSVSSLVPNDSKHQYLMRSRHERLLELRKKHYQRIPESAMTIRSCTGVLYCEGDFVIDWQ